MTNNATKMDKNTNIFDHQHVEYGVVKSLIQLCYKFLRGGIHGLTGYLNKAAGPSIWSMSTTEYAELGRLL
jgi:hypothetical protein